MLDTYGLCMVLLFKEILISWRCLFLLTDQKGVLNDQTPNLGHTFVHLIPV